MNDRLMSAKHRLIQNRLFQNKALAFGAGKQNLLKFLEETRTPECFYDAVIVAVFSGLFAVMVASVICSRVPPTSIHEGEVYGWVAAMSYPKQLDLLLYAASFPSVIVGIVCGWTIWCCLALLYQKVRSLRPPASLHRVATIWPGFFLVGVLLLDMLAEPLWLLFSLTAVASLIAYGVVAVASAACPIKQFDKFVLTVLIVASEYKRKIISSISSNHTPLTRNLGLVLVWIITPILLYLYLYDGGTIHGQLDLFHEGEKLAPLNAVLRGSFPYRDIYIQHGLFQNVGQSYMCSIIGRFSLSSLRFCETLLHPLAFVSLYFLGKHLFRSSLSAVALSLIASSPFMHDTIILAPDRSVLPLLALVCLVYGTRIYRDALSQVASNASQANCVTISYAVSGVLSGLAFLYSTENGIFILTASGLFLVVLACFRLSRYASIRLFPLGTYCAGVLVVAVPCSLWLHVNGALRDAVTNTYIQCAYQLAAWGLPFPSPWREAKTVTSLWSAAHTARYLSGWYLPIFTYLATTGIMIFQVMRSSLRKHGATLLLLPVLFFASLQMRIALGRSDLVHLYAGTPLVWVFILFGIEWTIGLLRSSAAEKSSAKLRVAFYSFILLLAAVLGSNSLYAHEGHIAQIIDGGTIPKFYKVEWEPLGGAKIPREQLMHLRRVVEFIDRNTEENDAIFDFSNQGAYYYLADRPSATRYHQVAYAVTADLQREVVQSLIRSNTKLVIYSTGGWFDHPDGICNARRQPIVARYIENYYRRRVDIDGTIILLKK